MDSGFSIQFTCCCESSQASVAKIRNSISPSTTGINHTSVTEREREAEGRNRGRERGWLSDEGCAAPLNVEPQGPDTGSWHCSIWDCSTYRTATVYGRFTSCACSFMFIFSLQLILLQYPGKFRTDTKGFWNVFSCYFLNKKQKLLTCYRGHCLCRDKAPELASSAVVWGSIQFRRKIFFD